MESRTCRYSIRCKRKREGYPYLAREIIFNILSWLPAEFLQNQVKYVCKTWASIVRDPCFVEAHVRRCNANCILIQNITTGCSQLRHIADSLLIQNTIERGNLLRCLAVKETMSTMTSRKINMKQKNESIVASSEGILLSLMTGNTLYVTNFITKRRLKLHFIYPKTCKVAYMYISSLAFIPQTKELKVIVPWLHTDGYAQYSVFTVGSGTQIGREIDLGVDVGVGVGKSFYVKPISINGVIYWTRFDQMYKLLAIDLRDEISHVIQIPEKLWSGQEGGKIRFVRMDNYLSYIVHGGTEINVWILKNIVNSEWVITRKIELPNVVGSRSPLVLDIWHHTAIAWLDNGRVILFLDMKNGGDKHPSNLFAYNLSTGVIKIIKNVNRINALYALIHTNTLVAW